MTFRAPPKNFIDKALDLVGIERQLLPPENIDELKARYGEHVDIRLKREGLIHFALRRIGIYEHDNENH